MNYQVSRNGQIYGPYTLDDLRRYLASGNVLLTDLAKSEAMTEWLLVSQILAGDAGGGAAVPVANETPTQAMGGFAPVSPVGSPGFTGSAGYAGGFSAAYVAPLPVSAALASSAYPDAPNLHWALVLLFSLLTCGLFMVIWNLIVAAWLKRVQPNALALFYYAGAYVLVVLLWLTPNVAVHHAFLPGIPSLHHDTGFVGGTLLLVVWVLRLVARYSEQASLEEHFNGPEPVGLTLNPVMTFFFGGLYFQHHLTRINAMKRAARFSMGV